jgi:hypothetical protein
MSGTTTIVETERRHGPGWGAPDLPGDPPRHFFSTFPGVPVSLDENVLSYTWVPSAWAYSKCVTETLASWHAEVDPFDQVRRRVWVRQ